jgi:tRNA nucleotidyltransferase (CCA-adding enzyme)
LYGGGGHARAAAALVRERDIVELVRDLHTNLHKFITPAVRVSEIMSRGLRDLKPETPAKEAAEKMRRYGYEGYPVVDGNRVVGLLTRRAVDRALAHGLNYPASSLMSAGSITISPTDSIEKLQKVMAESGWGQIPVQDPNTQVIVGIVTRTDLIKTLAPQDAQSRTRNLRDKLENALPVERLTLLEMIRNEAQIQHIALYIVGGFVRDLLLERPSLDFDLVVEGDGILLAKTLAQKYGGRVTSHHQFGTAKWHIGDSKFDDSTVSAQVDEKDKLKLSNLPDFLDFISARTEFYTHPTALPTVESGSIKLDLHRRDFTINTLALRLDGSHYGELHDYWGGMSDIRKGVVRVLHSLSFVDDPTRMLRAVRFEQRFGFRIDERTLDLLKEALSLLGKVSGDRIRHELDHCFKETNVLRIMKRLHELDLLKAIHPGLSWDNWLTHKFSHVLDRLSNLTQDFQFNYSSMGDNLLQSLLYVIWLIRLSPEQVGDICSRIRIPVGQTKVIMAASQLMRELPVWVSAKPSQITSRLDEVDEVAILAVCLSVETEQDCKPLQKYLHEWRFVRPTVTGEDIRKVGLPTGPIYKKILSKLRSAWLDDEIQDLQQESEMFTDLIRLAKEGIL